MRKKSLVPLLLIAFLCHAPAAQALNIDYGGDGRLPYYYAAQDTRTSQFSEYFGWAGVKGYLHWKNNASLTDTESKGLGCLSVKTAANSNGQWWVQTGMHQGYRNPNFSETGTPPSDSSRPYMYWEWYWGNTSNCSQWWGYGATAPYTQWLAAEYSGTTNQSGQPIWWVTNGSTVRSVAQPYASGKGTAQNEVEQADYWDYDPSQYTDAPTLYFGSNMAGWNGDSYALRLKSYAGWELWDESLTAGTTWAHQSQYIKYSPGYAYKYFGAWPW